MRMDIPGRLGNGIGKMLLSGKLAPVVGNVCMDMTMLDITDFKGIREGDEVIVFGEMLALSQACRLVKNNSLRNNDRNFATCQTYLF